MPNTSRQVQFVVVDSVASMPAANNWQPVSQKARACFNTDDALSESLAHNALASGTISSTVGTDADLVANANASVPLPRLPVIVCKDETQILQSAFFDSDNASYPGNPHADIELYGAPVRSGRLNFNHSDCLISRCRVCDSIVDAGFASKGPCLICADRHTPVDFCSGLTDDRLHVINAMHRLDAPRAMQ